MNIPAGIKPYIRGPKRVYALLGLILVIVSAVSVSTLTTKPRLWNDEAKSIELARGFSESGVLDIQYAPGKWTLDPVLFQSTGYPVTVPLGILFQWFGFSFTLARLYMVVWMLAALFVAFYFLKNFFDRSIALFSVLLIATFASFHDSGRTVVGEIPGFVFLLAGVYFAFQKKQFAYAGLFWSLAIVAKPSVFLLILPAVFVVLLFEPKRILGRLSALLISMLPAVFVWFALVGINPFGAGFAGKMVAFFGNPYGTDISANVIKNLSGFFGSTTLVYFGVLYAAIIAARFVTKRAETIKLYDFTIVYSLCAFVYYLRSPGWLRYIVIAELLILALIPHALLTLTHFVQMKIKLFRRLHTIKVTVACILVLTSIQTLHFFTMSDIFQSNSELLVSASLKEEYPDTLIAVLGSPELCVLLGSAYRSCVYDEFTGLPQIGQNPLFYTSPLPPVVVVGRASSFKEDGLTVLENNYRLSSNLLGYDIFKRVDE